MADKKISALTAATTPLAGTEVLPIVQSGATVKVANNDLRPKQIQSNATSGVLQIVGPAAASTRVMTTPDANFTAARTDAAQSFTGDQTLGTGNLIQGTAAKGVNFTANTPAAGMTSQLLNWYEEGTWTPTYSSGYSSVGYDDRLARYVRIGKQVTVWCRIDTSGASSTAATQIIISGLPFTSSNAATAAPGGGYIIQAKNIVVAGNIPVLRIPKNTSTVELWTLDDVSFNGTDLNSGDNIFAFVATYEAA